MSSPKASGNSLSQGNYGTDYVVVYRFHDLGIFHPISSFIPNLGSRTFSDADRDEATAGFEKLITELGKVGLQTEVRNGDEQRLLVFVRAADDRVLGTAAYRSRVKDWLYGIRQAQPDKETQVALTAEPLTEAERLRLVYHNITAPASEGGANIVPGGNGWKEVEAIFPLHDHQKNKSWISDWSRKTFLTTEDLDDIRNQLGEKIAYYFAFLQSYFAFLMFPAAFGFSCWVLLGHYSPVYAIVNGLWSIVFVEWWKRQEADLAIRWGVRGVSSILDKRRSFQHEKEIVDPVTGETIQFFPSSKRIQRQLLQIPFALLAGVALGAIIATCFGIEIFISEVYDGPLKNFASRLTDYENYETQESHDIAMTQKVFVLNFITSYLGIFLTAFVYVPFATIIVPYLDVFSLTVKPFATDEKQMQTPQTAEAFQINPDRLRKQVIYFTVTAQIVNFALETIVPFLKRKGTSKFKAMQHERAAKKGGAAPIAAANDIPEEKAFLARVRSEADLDDYDVTSDLREMVVQYGYLTLFSVVWPLVPVSFLVNNWLELRSDTFKITVECKRPTPQRADSIGPWLDSLGFFSWLGSITTAALVYMFSDGGLGPDGNPSAIKGWALLLTIFFAEHIYLLVRIGVRTAISKMDSPNMQKDRAEKYMVRKRYLEETMDTGKGATTTPPQGIESSISRKSLEDEARDASLKDSKPEDRFWARQRGVAEVVRVGRGYIDGAMPAGNETKKGK
ncbi:MAG: hypothetical protein Q9227_009578 [Pyrenula ochraceoflavens]